MLSAIKYTTAAATVATNNSWLATAD